FLQPLRMRGRAEDCAAVGALSLEHAACVMQPMGQHVQRRARPGHELAVIPDDAVASVEGLLHDIFLREAKSFSPVHQRPAGPVAAYHSPSASRRAAPSPARPAVLRRGGTPDMVGRPRAGLSPGRVSLGPHDPFAEARPLVTIKPKYVNMADVTALPASRTA